MRSLVTKSLTCISCLVSMRWGGHLMTHLICSTLLYLNSEARQSLSSGTPSGCGTHVELSACVSQDLSDISASKQLCNCRSSGYQTMFSHSKYQALSCSHCLCTSQPSLGALLFLKVLKLLAAANRHVQLREPNPLGHGILAVRCFMAIF